MSAQIITTLSDTPPPPSPPRRGQTVRASWGRQFRIDFPGSPYSFTGTVLSNSVESGELRIDFGSALSPPVWCFDRGKKFGWFRDDDGYAVKLSIKSAGVVSAAVVDPTRDFRHDRLEADRSLF